MATARLLDRPEDFKLLGINQHQIEAWEDRRRNADTSPNNWEWWYSDFIFDDGTTAVVQFFPKAGKHLRKHGDYPVINLRINLPDGSHYKDEIAIDAKDASFGDNQCEVRFGPHFFVGDLRNYHIHVEPIKGYGVDLNLSSQSKPYRPGTAYFEFGNPGNHYTWFCAVPKGEVSGTLTYDGKTKEIHGFGYHDHQWGNTNFLKGWNHWLWARQSFDDYSVLVFDMVAAEKYNHERFPIVFIQDKEGNLIFENTHGVKCEVLDEYTDTDVSDKTYPKEVRYTFENNGVKIIYRLKEKGILETGGVNDFTGLRKLLTKLMGIKLSYTRYIADSDISIITNSGTTQRAGELIYEFMFPGSSYEGHMAT